MNKLTCLSLVLLLLSSAPVITAADSPKGATLHDIKCIALAVELTDFPIQQRKLKDQIFGELITNTYGFYGFDRSFDGHTESFQVWTLTDPNNPSGYYSVRLTYDRSNEKSEETPISAITVMFTAPNHMRFAYESIQVPKPMDSEFKARFKKSGLTPREFAIDVYKYDAEIEAMENTATVSKPDTPSTK